MFNKAEYFKTKDSFNKSSVIKKCFHENEDCKGKIIQSHSLQHNGRLSIISENHQVCTPTSTTITEYENGNISRNMLPISIKKASTFYGFCSYHDTSLFSIIENNKFDKNNKEHLFLHSYRSFAHSNHRKNEEHKAYNSDTEFTKMVKQSNNDHCGYHIDGLNMGINDGVELKKYLEYFLENKIFDGLEYFVYEKSGLYPFASSSTISPLVSYTGKRFYHLNIDKPLNRLMLTFLPDKDSTFAILAAFKTDNDSLYLINELKKLAPLKIEKAITSLLISNTENIFFSPSVFNKNEIKTFMKEIEETMVIPGYITEYNLEYMKKFFHSSLNFFDDKYRRR
jgi:hypothetical protein